MNDVLDSLNCLILCIFFLQVRDKNEFNVVEIGLSGLGGFDLFDTCFIAHISTDVVTSLEGFDERAIVYMAGGAGDEDEGGWHIVDALAGYWCIVEASARSSYTS
jgi:hypothetical protein